MATHSSILAWEIPWTEEPGGLQSMKLQRVGHGCVCVRPCACAHTHTLEVQDQCGSRLVFSAASSWLADSCPLQVPSRCETAVSSHHLCSALAHPWSQCVPTSSSSKDSSHMGLELTLTVSF